MKSKTFIGGLLAGIAAGVAVGILVTSGNEETKKKIVKGAKKLANSVKDTAGNAIDELKDQYASSDQPGKRRSESSRTERNVTGNM